MTAMLIALGGGLGAVARWGIAATVPRAADGFPLGITIVNVVGSFTLGLIVGLAASEQIVFATEPLTIGLLGGFTTFSTWMVDIDESSTTRMGWVVSVIPIVLGLAAAALGLWLGLGLDQ